MAPSGLSEKFQLIAVAETAELNVQLDSHVGGDIYSPMHPLRTFVAFHKLWEKAFT